MSEFLCQGDATSVERAMRNALTPGPPRAECIPARPKVEFAAVPLAGRGAVGLWPSRPAINYR
eukprot:scaffold182840_cov35-Tisochrysis_lutea.AAC.2